MNIMPAHPVLKAGLYLLLFTTAAVLVVMFYREATIPAPVPTPDLRNYQLPLLEAFND